MQLATLVTNIIIAYDTNTARLQQCSARLLPTIENIIHLIFQR